MQTPGNSQTLIPCADPNCDKSVPAGGRRKYHDAGCRSAATDNSRHAFFRLRKKHALIASDKKRLALLVRLARNPFSSGERPDARLQELNELNGLLSRVGPIPEIRSEVQRRVLPIYNELLQKRPQTSDESFQYICTLEILRDIGVETVEGVPRVRRHSWEIVQYYLGIKDNLRLCRALMAHAHAWRLDGHEYQARNFYTYPYHILREYRGERNLDYWILRHNATLWYLRFFLDNVDDAKRGKTLKELIAMARDVNTPAVWLQTRCELAGYWASIRQDRDRALEQHHKVEQLLQTNEFPKYGLHGPMRPKIHALLESGIPSDRDEAIHLIRSEFLALYQKDPHFYYCALLEGWSNQLKLSLKPRRPVYGSGNLTYLPRN